MHRYTLLLIPTLLLACSADHAATTERGPLGKADIFDGSCASPEGESCDGQSDGACFCDADCESFGDCCFDYVEVCTDGASAQLFLSEGLHAPESIAFDAETDTYYVSNMGRNILTEPAKEGIGYVSRYSANGALLEEKFAVGLDEPKGVAVVRDTVYVADPKAVVAYDKKTGAERARYTIEGIGGINDLALDPSDGTIYITDSVEPVIYQLDPTASPSMRVVARDSDIEFGNGLAVRGNTLVMGSFGLFASDERPATLGKIYIIDKIEAAVTTLDKARARWDGVVILGDGTIAANDFATGDIFRIDEKTGELTRLHANETETDQPLVGMADMGLFGSRLLIPSMFTNEVYAVTPSY